MKRKRRLSLVVALIMLLTLSTPAMADNISQIIGDNNTVVFIDVPDTHWAKEQIYYFAEQGIISGRGDGTFAPNDGVKRNEFCKMMVLSFHASLVSPEEQSFSDVAPDNWAYPYVETSKEFLTGYANPFGGKPTFHPAEYATREDIAVALVRMMGLTDQDASYTGSSLWKFSDAGEISPQLKDYVSVAVEQGLINGYPDGTFRPTKGITRAETVTLLNRATKQAMTSINADLNAEADIRYSDDGKTAYVVVMAETGSTATVNGESLKMERSYDYDGYYVGTLPYIFTEEGQKSFTVEVKKAGKAKMFDLTAKYEIGAPVLSITQCPTSVTSKEVTIRGTVKDNNNVALTINGESVSTPYGSFSKSYTLKEGVNTFTFVATNDAGKTTTETRTITFTVGDPVLTITSCPESVTTKEVTIRGNVSDSNYSVSLTINGESVSTPYGSFSKTYTLKEGANTFTFVATSAAGKSVTETRTINFSVGGPTLTITDCPENVTKKEVTIRGNVSDSNYSVSLTINGESVSTPYNSFSKTYTLKEGTNTFIFVATSAAGKSVTETRTINFSVGGPTLTITDCPENVTKKEVTIRGNVSDSNYSVSLTINGESVSMPYNSFSKTYTLKEGANTFTFVATNSAGKSTTETRTINLSLGSPEFLFLNCPESTTNDQITIRGRVTGENSGALLYINDKEVSVGYNGEFSATYTLSEGINSFTFRAVNSYGKSVTETKTIFYAPAGTGE